MRLSILLIIMLRLIATLLLLTIPHAKPIALTYNSSLHTITLFTSQGAPVLLTITFDSPDLSLH